MKNYYYPLVFIFFLILSCTSKKSAVVQFEQPLTVKNDTLKIAKNTVKIKNDTIRIANDSLEYEVIIIDPGFSTWLDSRSLPRGYHSLTYLEIKNTKNKLDKCVSYLNENQDVLSRKEPQHTP